MFPGIYNLSTSQTILTYAFNVKNCLVFLNKIAFYSRIFVLYITENKEQMNMFQWPWPVKHLNEIQFLFVLYYFLFVKMIHSVMYLFLFSFSKNIIVVNKCIKYRIKVFKNILNNKRKKVDSFFLFAFFVWYFVKFCKI